MVAVAVLEAPPGMLVVVVVLPVAVKDLPFWEKISVTSDCIFHEIGPVLPWQASRTWTPPGAEVIAGASHCIPRRCCFQKSDAPWAQTLCCRDTVRPSADTVELTCHSPCWNEKLPL